MSPVKRRSSFAFLIAAVSAAVLTLNTVQAQGLTGTTDDSSTTDAEHAVATESVAHPDREQSSEMPHSNLPQPHTSETADNGAEDPQSDPERKESDPTLETDKEGIAPSDPEGISPQPAPMRTALRAATNNAPTSADANDPSIPEALFANNGSGRFKDLIQWMQWANRDDYDAQGAPRFPGIPQNDIRNHIDPRTIVLDPGYAGDASHAARTPVTSQTRHNRKDVGQDYRVVTSCVVRNLSHAATSSAISVRKTAPLVASVPGAWHRDFLDNLYSVGGFNAANQLVIGLANVSPNQVGWRPGDGSTPSFDLSCTAAVWSKTGQNRYGNPRSFPIDGLVFADAETASNGIMRSGASVSERVQVTTAADVQWRVLDQFRSPFCVPQAGQMPVLPSPNNREGATSSFGILTASSQTSQKTLVIQPNGPECFDPANRASDVTNPGAVLFAEGVTSANVLLHGTGAQAVAVGVMVPSDFGDAPASYGNPVAFYRPDWGTHTLVEGTNDLVYGIQSAPERQPATFRLGADTSNDNAEKHSVGADADSGDDALSANDLQLVALPGLNLSRTVSCGGNGIVAGWIDWDVNGTFEDAEKSNQVRCTNGSATLTWAVPRNVKRAVRNEVDTPNSVSYLRLRTADSQDAFLPGDGALSPIDPTASGEVEDYAVEIFAPMLKTVVEVVDPHHYADRLESPSSWTVRAIPVGQHQPVHRLSGSGGFDWTHAQFLMYALSSNGPGNRPVPGYTTEGWRCSVRLDSRYPQGVTPSFELNRKSSRLWMKAPDRMICTIQYTPTPAVLKWSKISADGTALAGSQWSLQRPNNAQAVTIADCRDQTCSNQNVDFVDRDPRPGYFDIGNLAWGRYVLTESRAPAGYQLRTQEESVTFSGQVLERDFGGIVNELREPVAIPLTGGTASVLYVAGGLMVTLLSVAGGAAVGRWGRHAG